MQKKKRKKKERKTKQNKTKYTVNLIAILQHLLVFFFCVSCTPPRPSEGLNRNLKFVSLCIRLSVISLFVVVRRRIVPLLRLKGIALTCPSKKAYLRRSNRSNWFFINFTIARFRVDYRNETNLGPGSGPVIS